MVYISVHGERGARTYGHISCPGVGGRRAESHSGRRRSDWSRCGSWTCASPAGPGRKEGEIGHLKKVLKRKRGRRKQPATWKVAAGVLPLSFTTICVFSPLNFRYSRRSAFYDVTKGKDTSIMLSRTAGDQQPPRLCPPPTTQKVRQSIGKNRKLLASVFSCGCKQRAKLSPALFLQIYRECVVQSIAQGCSAAFQHEHERSSVKGFEVGRSNPQSRKLLHPAKRDACLILTGTKFSPLLPLSIA